MTSRSRVRLYKGVVQAQAEERFRADAVWAARDGWHPAEWRWDGNVLRVTYTLERRDPFADAPPVSRRRGARLRAFARLGRP